MEAQTISQTLQALKTRLPALEAQVLLGHVLNVNKTWLAAHPETLLTSAQQAQLVLCLQQYTQGIPLPYILGRWEFYGMDFFVAPDVLIPRPETELLVETALAWAQAHPRPSYRCIDIGTGSGVIAITMAKSLPIARFDATDISPDALTIARQNARKHNLESQITFHRADLFPETQPARQYDLILANPPYIPTSTLQGLEVFGREPTLALDGGPDGLETIRRLLAASKRRAAAGGLVLVEIEATLGEAVGSLAASQFDGASIQILKDLAGHDRLLKIET